VTAATSGVTTRFVPRGAVAAAMIAAGLAVGACGTSQASSYARQAPSQIARDVSTAVAKASAVAVAGRVTLADQLSQVSFEVKVPLELKASITQGSRLIRLIELPHASYLYANAAFWHQQAKSLSASQVAGFANRWFRVPATEAVSLVKDLGAGATPQKLASCLAHTLHEPTVRGTSSVNGDPAVVLRFRGGTPTTVPGTLSVDAAAPHYPLALQETGTTQPGGGACAHTPLSSDNGRDSLTFSHWNAVTITAPAHASVLP
jgi:hypothetical protein